MQTISQKPGFEVVIDSDVLDKITAENDFICLEDEDEDAINAFVDENTNDLRNGSPSDELLAGLRGKLSKEVF